LFVYDENVRVPFLYALPGWADEAAPATQRSREPCRKPAGHRADDSRLAGLPRQLRHQGVSLLDPAPRMAPFFTDYSLGWLGLADGCWTYRFPVRFCRGRRSMTCCRDPDEKFDRAGEFGDRVKAYRDRVTSWVGNGRETLLR
jgi:hypothetical protein